jgi:hypothetical protein
MPRSEFMLKNYLKQTKAYPLLRFLKSYLEAVLWFFGSKQQASPPALFKRAVIKKLARKFSPSIFVETGTYLGDTVAAVKNLFFEIHSIELGENLAEEARKRFLRYPHIHIHQGDSAQILPSLLGKTLKPSLFWLDAHYSEGVTVGDDEHLPLISEIKTILGHWVSGSVILIDDARLMGCQKGYPSFEEIEVIVKGSGLNLEVKQDLDIIRIY